MIHSVCGLSADQVGLVVHALSHSDDKDLATLFITSLALIDTTLLLLLKEMFSTRKHILYWTQLAKSPSWELFLYRLNSVVFKSVFVNKDRDYLILDSSELMLRHAEMLRSDLSDLSILLEKVIMAASSLKAVYVQLNSVGGTMSNERRKLGLIKPDMHSESDFQSPEKDSFDDIGVKLGLSMVSVDEEQPSMDSTHQLYQQQQGRVASVFGLSVPSEDDEWEIRENAAEVLDQQQRVLFERKDSESGAEELSLIRRSVRRELEQCLVGLAESFAEFLPHLVLALPLPRASLPLPLATPVSSIVPTVNPVGREPPLAPENTNAGAHTENASTSTHPCPLAKLNPSGKRVDLSLQELEELYDRLETFLDTLRLTRGSKAFPLQFTQARVHKPSDRERYWFRNLLVGMCGLYTVKTIVSLWRDGSVLAGYQFLQLKIHDHIVEPMTSLAEELFDTIRKRETVVTKEECEESRESLHRMLHDFSKTDRGSSLIADMKDMKDRIKDTINEQKQAAVNVASKITGQRGNGGSGSTDAGAVNSSGAGAGVESGGVGPASDSSSSGGGGGGVRAGGGGRGGVGPDRGAGAGRGGGGRGGGAGGAGSGGGTSSSSAAEFAKSAVRETAQDEFTPEQAMAALMRAYEKELQAPIKGVMFGNLTTAILIQMQKLKVHTEVAMLKMDQILASNELTIAATAAMPAFAFIGMSLLWLRKWLQPRASSPGLATLHLRLIMSDVERSLQEVHELANSGHGSICNNNSATSMYYAAGGSSRAASAIFDPTTHMPGQAAPLLATHLNSPANNPRGRTRSGSSVELRDTKGHDAKLQRYQASLSARRIQIARGTLQFNLVRLRSEFQNLFGGSKGTVVSVGSDSVSKARGLSLTRGANRGLGLGGGASLGMSMSMGLGFTSPRAEFSVASTVRKYRLRRTSSATASTMFAAEPSSESALPAVPKESVGVPSIGEAAAVEADKMALVNQMLTIMQSDESQEDFSGSFFSIAVGVLRRLYAMIAGSGEELTSTTQYSSLSRDIALLESPDFEVSLDRKICTAARMRATYSCLMPTQH